MATLHEFSTAQLRQALQIREQIDDLQRKLGALLNGEGSASATTQTRKPVGRPSAKRSLSPEARAKIGAAQKVRWAKAKAPAAPAAPVAKSSAKTAKKKGGLTAEGRAKLAAAMKARWAARKKGGAAPNAPAA